MKSQKREGQESKNAKERTDPEIVRKVFYRPEDVGEFDYEEYLNDPVIQKELEDG